MRGFVKANGLILAAITLVAAGEGSLGHARASDTFPVTGSHDNTPFSYKLVERQEFESFSVNRTTYPSPVTTRLAQNNTIVAELYLPKGSGNGQKPRPAVVCLHILGGGFELAQLQCSALARRGIPAIWFKLPYYGERGPPEGTRVLAANPRLFSEAIHQGVEDVRRTIDVLASRPEVDRRHIGVMGVSLGGILAATAAEQDPRIDRAVLILAGGDLLPIVKQARETRRLSETIGRLPAAERADVERAILAADPLEHADALRQRARQGRVLMINAAEDEVIPKVATVKLATALGIEDRIVWLPGLGHYTALAALPQALKTAVDFFSKELPADVAAAPPMDSANPRQELVGAFRQAWQFIDAEPEQGRCRLADLECQVTLKGGKTYSGSIRVARGSNERFSGTFKLAGVLDNVALGNSKMPWLAAKGNLFLGVGDETAREATSPGIRAADGTRSVPATLADGTGDRAYYFRVPLSPECQRGLTIMKGFVDVLTMVPEILDQWVAIDGQAWKEGAGRTIEVVRRGSKNDVLHLYLHADGTPARLEVDWQGSHAVAIFRAWKIDAPTAVGLFEPPQGLRVKKVSAADLASMFNATVNLAVESVRTFPSAPLSNSAKIVGRDLAGHGFLTELHGKRLLFVQGTPQQMGAAQGTLLRPAMTRLMERVVYGMGAVDTVSSGTWWFDRVDEIGRRTGSYLPARFLTECDAMAKAAGISVRDARAANLFPERFHCSGVAVRGKATLGGHVLHARVLDYMTEIGLQNHACVTVFLPEGRHSWISAGYAGFLGTVTAMNECGLAVGEMGGRGEGQWDGVPMSFLLRDVMERAATVEEALAILKASRRTCEYYYVISDKSRNMVGVRCTPEEMTVLQPGEQHPRLPHVPEDTVLISGGSRAETLSERIEKSYGRIDVAGLMEIIKRPVAMNSNLHDAIFSPETLDLWIADAGEKSPACDEPYAQFNLKELLGFFDRNRME